MTRKSQIEELLKEIPAAAMPQVVDFLKGLVRRPAPRGGKVSARRQDAGLAQRTFGRIPAEVAVVRQALSEDLYGLE